MPDEEEDEIRGDINDFINGEIYGNNNYKFNLSKNRIYDTFHCTTLKPEIITAFKLEDSGTENGPYISDQGGQKYNISLSKKDVGEVISLNHLNMSGNSWARPANRRTISSMNSGWIGGECEFNRGMMITVTDSSGNDIRIEDPSYLTPGALLRGNVYDIGGWGMGAFGLVDWGSAFAGDTPDVLQYHTSVTGINDDIVLLNSDAARTDENISVRWKPPEYWKKFGVQGVWVKKRIYIKINQICLLFGIP